MIESLRDRLKSLSWQKRQESKQFAVKLFL